MGRDEFLAALDTNPVVVSILERAHQLEVPNWYLTAGGLFQTVWNNLAGHDPQNGIRDYDYFYFDDSDISYEAEDRIIRRAAALFADLGVDVEVRNQARVHLWYEDHFGAPLNPYRSTEDAIDHFVSTTCCFGVRSEIDGSRTVYVPHGYEDLFAGVIRPNPLLPMRAVYESKAARWTSIWPELTVEPWRDYP